MSDVIDLAEWRRARFQCEICARRSPTLVGVRLSRWIDYDGWEILEWDEEELRRYKELTTLRVSLICSSCYSSFHVESAGWQAFHEHDSKVYRLACARQPVEYDRAKWLRYLRRRSRQEGR